MKGNKYMKVLIFYGSYGGGHLSAAKSIKLEIETYYPDIEVKMVDCIEYVNKYINKITTEAYKELVKKVPQLWNHVYNDSQSGPLASISTTSNKLMSYKLNNLLQEFNPDLIISTHPFSTQMCGILKDRGKINCKIATVLTDFHIHAQWLLFSEYMDYYFVSNEQMKQDMMDLKIPSEKIHVTGIPVSTRFSENFDKPAIYKEFELDPEKETILFFAGGEFGIGRNTTVMALKAFERLFKNVQVVAVSGRNPKMKAKFEKLVETTNSQHRIKVLEFTNKVPELMSISSMVVTKPGGLTVTESLVSHLPIIIINPIPGQEEQSAQFLVENNVAIWIKKDDNVARALKNLYRHPERVQEMKKNTFNLARPNSTRNICEILLK